MNDELSDFKVTNKETFIEFIDLLREDLITNPETWENRTLKDFLFDHLLTIIYTSLLL